MWKHHIVTSALCGKIAHQMCVSQFSPFFAKRKRHLGGAFRIFMKKSQILCSKFGLYDFFFYFRHFQSSWIFDFYIWVLLVDLSTSFFYGNNIADVHKSSLHQRCCTLIVVTTNKHEFTLMPCGAFKTGWILVKVRVLKK